IVLPVPGGQTTINRADLTLSFGETAGEEWSGRITVDNLNTAEFSARATEIALGGLARNLDDAAARSITFAVDGALSGIVARQADVGAALGDRISLDIDGAWNAGQPVTLQQALVSGNG